VLVKYVKKAKMQQEIGQQYMKDNAEDPSGFLAKARLYQSRYRATVLDVPCDEYGNHLQRADAWDKGLNFYDDFGIFGAVKERYPKYSKPLYANMLRSEHIPFNLFIPLQKAPDYSRVVLAELMDLPIRSVENIRIEYAPKPAEKYLNDKTSFDAYVEYLHEDEMKGILGIEVKYTEREYRLIPDSKEHEDINDSHSKYFSVTEESGLYKSYSIPLLKTDRFRQIWRNQLLGESILLEDKDEFKHFTSVTIYPEGNTHFVEASREYMDQLARNDRKFVPVTYERVLAVCEKHCPDERYVKWIEYMRERYIVVDS
jgi:hypothetical protein